eukprot:COSAG04_NODE_3005_length_3286_cov_1.777848_2_plen_282_part_00
MQNYIRNALDDHSHPISPRMSLKCAYYLTDCRAVGCGNTWIVPGSVDTDLANGATLFPADHSGPLGQPPGAIPVQVPANSCMIFDRRVWHAATPNWAQYERMVVFMGCVFLCMLMPARLRSSSGCAQIRRSLAGSARCHVRRGRDGDDHLPDQAPDARRDNAELRALPRQRPRHPAQAVAHRQGRGPADRPRLAISLRADQRYPRQGPRPDVQPAGGSRTRHDPAQPRAAGRAAAAVRRGRPLPLARRGAATRGAAAPGPSAERGPACAAGGGGVRLHRAG